MFWVLGIVGGLIALVALAVLIGWLLPQNHVAHRRALFRQSSEALWETITGPPTWRPDVKSFEMLLAREGRKVWCEVDLHGQRITFEEVEAVPPSRLVGRIADPKLPFGGSWTYELLPGDGGTTLAITERGEIYNPFFRFMARFVFGYTSTLEKYLRNLGKKFGEEVRIEG